MSFYEVFLFVWDPKARYRIGKDGLYLNVVKYAFNFAHQRKDSLCNSLQFQGHEVLKIFYTVDQLSAGSFTLIYYFLFAQNTTVTKTFYPPGYPTL
jgi:hypothetical protein